MSQESYTVSAGESMRLPRLSERSLFIAFAALMLVCLQFQTIPIRIQVQTVPVTSVLAILFFPFVLRNIPRSPVLDLLLLFLGFVLFHSAVTVAIDLFSGHPDNRFLAWLRQSFALTGGIILFMVFRTVFLHISFEQVSRWIIIGALPGIALSFLNIAALAFGSESAGNIVIVVREIVSPEAYTGAGRASGFATEPSSWAASLVITVLPLLLVYLWEKKRRWWVIPLVIASGLAFAWTFSMIGLILLFTILVGGMIFGPKRKLMMLLMVTSLITLGSVFILFPRNQVFRHAGVLIAGKANVSFTDRYYGAFGPFMRMDDSYSILGYGLGGVSTHYKEVVPKHVQREIFESKWKEFPNLTILFGRLYAETGAVGLALFLLAMGMTFWQLRVVLRNETDPRSRLALMSIRLVWIAVCVSIFVTIGPYQTPYLWLWMAFIDSRYVLQQKKKLAE